MRLSSTGIAAISTVVAALFFGLPVLGSGGFNEYGYNYNARVFEGWYGQWSAFKYGTPLDDSMDAMLVMKWSKDWIPMEDEPVGAWCTNHWTWYTNDYQTDWYGFDARTPWSDSVEPTGSYMVTEFMKIMRVGDNGAAWLAYEAGGAYDAGWGTNDQWWVLGDWVISVLSTYTHDMSITIQTYDEATGSYSGTAVYPAVGTPQLYETITGTVIGTTVTMTFTQYEDAGHTMPTGYTETATGTIDTSDGSISGTSPWEWHSTSGHAFQVPDYVVFQDVIDVHSTTGGGLVAQHDLCITPPMGLGQPIF